MFFATIALLAALSCAKQDGPELEDPNSAPVFTVDIEESYISTDNDEKKHYLSWDKDDLVSVFHNTAGNSQYKFAGKTGDFTGTITAIRVVKGGSIPTYYAIYPYSDSNSLSNNTLYFTLPAEQTYTGEGLGVKSSVMVAKQAEEGDYDFNFKNICGYIGLRLYGSAEVASIELKGNNNEVLTGNASFDMTSDKLSLSGNGKAITLTCGNGATLGLTESTATDFILVIPPTTFDKGVTITITDTEGNTIEEEFDSKFTVERNQIHSLTMEFDGDISATEAEEIMNQMVQEWLTSTKSKYATAIANNVFTNNGLQLKIWTATYGEKPAGGRSLYISMHGGGSAPASTNDGQWDNQKYLYTPEEGVYVAPRAPWDEWNMWFKEGLDELFEQLIQAAVATWDVNPDKVYLMGYSAGGDGAYKMGPRMADRWAAVSMMAGHPNGVSMLSLRNTPFSIWVGANDSSFNRNTVAAEYDKILDALHAEDPYGYIHETHIVAGKGHWMDNEDRAAVPWMAKFTRDPYPVRVVWRQAEVKRTSFYWISIDESEYKNEATIIAEIDGNTINVSKCDYKNVNFHLNDHMINLDEPVVINFNDTEVFNGMVKRSRKAMESSLAERGDIRYIFPAVVNVKMETKNSLENPTGGNGLDW